MIFSEIILKIYSICRSRFKLLKLKIIVSICTKISKFISLFKYFMIDGIFQERFRTTSRGIQTNAMADYKELWELRDQNQYLSEANLFLKDEFNNILSLLTDPETRDKIFSIADALIGGEPVITSGGGGGSDSDFRWDGRRPDEGEITYPPYPIDCKSLYYFLIREHL